MKKFPFTIVILSAVVFAATAIAQPRPPAPTGHESDMSVKVTDVAEVANGKPCKVHYRGTLDYIDMYETTVYYDSDGHRFLEERSLSKRKTNGWGNVIYKLEHEEKIVREGDFLAWKQTVGYSGEKRMERISNNYDVDEEKHFRYRPYPLGWVFYDDKCLDSKGNWLRGTTAGISPKEVKRTIVYYGENPAVERELKEKQAFADSIIAESKKALPTASERSSYNFRNKPNWLKNFFLPIILGFLAAFTPTKFMAPRPKISNFKIYVVNLLLVIAIWYPIADFIYSIGPYDGLRAFIYWIILFFAYMLTLKNMMAGRCPKCGEYNFEKIGERTKVTTKTTVAKNEHGKDEVLSRNTDVQTDFRLRCRSCGHEWWWPL